MFLRRGRRERKNGDPKGTRTPVAGMKTRCPRPLDDGVTTLLPPKSIFRQENAYYTSGRATCKPNSAGITANTFRGSGAFSREALAEPHVVSDRDKGRLKR